MYERCYITLNSNPLFVLTRMYSGKEVTKTFLSINIDNANALFVVPNFFCRRFENYPNDNPRSPLTISANIVKNLGGGDPIVCRFYIKYQSLSGNQSLKMRRSFFPYSIFDQQFQFE